MVVGYDVIPHTEVPKETGCPLTQLQSYMGNISNLAQLKLSTIFTTIISYKKVFLFLNGIVALEWRKPYSCK